MIEKNIEVLRKILYAVETGGQVYGKQRYDAFIGAGANTPNEKAITIGAGQWYAGEAKRLLQEIQRADPVQFKRLDSQGIEGDLLHKNWSRYAISPTSAKAKCITKLTDRYTENRDTMLLSTPEPTRQTKRQLPSEQDSGTQEKQNGSCRRFRERIQFSSSTLIHRI